MVINLSNYWLCKWHYLPLFLTILFFTGCAEEVERNFVPPPDETPLADPAPDEPPDPTASPDPCSSIACVGSATVTWNSNNEPDISHYRIYYGTEEAGQFMAAGTTNTVSNNNSIVINGLMNGKRYYFEVSAFDLSGNESDVSSKVFKDIAL